MTYLYEIVVVMAMVALNAVFAAYEMALAAVSKSRLDMLASEKKKGAAEALFMKNRMEVSLAVVQLGVTLAGVVAAATGGAATDESLSPFLVEIFGFPEGLAEITALICLVIPLSLLLIIFAELVPKMFALQNKEKVCLTLSPMMKNLAQISYPMVRILEAAVKKGVILISRGQSPPASDDKSHVLHELRAAANLAKASRLIGSQVEKIVLSAAHLSLRTIGSIMIPAPDIFMISADCDLGEALVKAHLDMHTRFPVCARAGDPETIQGYVNFKDIVNALKVNPADPTLRGIMRPIHAYYEDATISEVLEQMTQAKSHISLIRSRDGKVAGLVTLVDILEELIGEIQDEFDRLPTHIHNHGSTWMVGGGVPVKKLAEALGIDLTGGVPGAGERSFAEWFYQKLGRTPAGGESLEVGELFILVRKLRRKKLAEAVVSKILKS